MPEWAAPIQVRAAGGIACAGAEWRMVIGRVCRKYPALADVMGRFGGGGCLFLWLPYPPGVRSHCCDMAVESGPLSPPGWAQILGHIGN